MNEKRLHAVPGAGTPITEADLHAYADGQLPPTRRAEVEAFLASHPQDQARVDEWRDQRRLLHAMLDPVLDEPLPLRTGDRRARTHCGRLCPARRHRPRGLRARHGPARGSRRR